MFVDAADVQDAAEDAADGDICAQRDDDDGVAYAGDAELSAKAGSASSDHSGGEARRGQ